MFSQTIFCSTENKSVTGLKLHEGEYMNCNLGGELLLIINYC